MSLTIAKPSSCNRRCWLNRSRFGYRRSGGMKWGMYWALRSRSMAVELMSALLAYEFDEVPLRTEYGLAVLEHMR
ncbi:hypothetical protein COMA2_110136 [Candidatus Nitrospira nitrificans]|uniref:Uncharacterized protein n=1 Tax=Candidatus Nitrospira nitrificans TaxID=1742973 RepID=A0A0S4L7X8_9BACT|nr:hypothetical protein COMA2_110136 [Candidatus Nitrospira nitrificans]